MKIADFISRAIQEYPSLYKDTNYEKSKMKVLDHVFFTNGNGLAMAKPGEGEEGGYVVDPKYKKNKVTDEWERSKDKPYGKEKYRKLPADYFDSVVYYVYGSDRQLDTVYKKNAYGDAIYFRYPKKSDDVNREPRVYKAESIGPFSPYPFSEGYSLACDVFYKGTFLQEDWMKELVPLCERTLEYFNNPEEYKENVYFPSVNKINKDLRYFNERFDKDGAKGVKDLRKIWGYENKETVPDYEEIEKRKNKSWEKFHKGQLKFLTGFLEKYKNENKSDL